MKALAIVVAVLLLAACASSSLTVSKTGMVTATVQGTGFGDFKTTVVKMKAAIDEACMPGKATPGGSDTQALIADLNENEAARFITIIERINANAEQLKQLRTTLEGWLPSHSFTWNGKCG